ncbi:hypothetical protein B0A48_13676 [Cryoendolithus antarcticus]|uniref:GATA-type domain-containing protein n=1 Tax=Cryoendolithus antarcticus TaxID=1507870 RepID=A0A1V8SMI4_9PEZI|nr:hypothetical protein B0A48_13676 [Cryoendolithus antarcticus]
MEQYFRTKADVDDPDLQQVRRKNDSKLKSRFEHIFAKYEKDFTGVGDEIDLDTGEIIVDNGHLESMRHEVDPGKEAGAQLVRAFADDLEIEGAESGSDDDADEPTDAGATTEATPEADDQLVDEESESGYTSSGIITNDSRPASSRSTPVDLDVHLMVAGEISRTDAARTKKRKRGLPDHTLRGRAGSQATSQSASSTSSSRAASPMTLLENIPFLKESMRAMQEKARPGEALDAGTIKELGQSIASQLAQYMSGAEVTSMQASAIPSQPRQLSPWEFPELPGDRRTRTPSPPPLQVASSVARLAMSPGGGGSLWAPMVHPRQRKRRRTKLRQVTVDLTLESDGDDPLSSDSPYYSVEPSHVPEDTAQLRTELQDAAQTEPKRVCTNCGDSSTTNFRKGPNGDLCNACGMYYYRYGLLKPPYNPEPSPPRPEPQPGTFSVLVPSGHSAFGIGELTDYDIPMTPAIDRGSVYTANTARRIVAGNVRMSRFTQDEDEIIIKCREVDDLPWEAIGRLVSGRSAYAVQGHYSRTLRSSPSVARTALLEQGYRVLRLESVVKEPEIIVIDDDERDEMSQACTGSSSIIDPALTGESLFIPDTASQSVKSARRTAYPTPEDGVCRVFKRFSAQEDADIRKLREDDRLSWAEIAPKVPGRTLLSVQKHYRRQLVPKSLQTFDEDGNPAIASHVEPFSGFRNEQQEKEEDNLIRKMREEECMTFAEMTEYLTGRTEGFLGKRYAYLKACDILASHKRTPPLSASGLESPGGTQRLTIGEMYGASRARPSPLPFGAAKKLLPWQYNSSLAGPSYGSAALARNRASVPQMPSKTPQQSRYTAVEMGSGPQTPVAQSPSFASPAATPVAVPNSINHPRSLAMFQTPAAPIPRPEHPPRPAAVGSSAWEATQPLDKGPLPFVPARKGSLHTEAGDDDDEVTHPVNVAPGSARSDAVTAPATNDHASAIPAILPSQIAHTCFVPLNDQQADLNVPATCNRVIETEDANFPQTLEATLDQENFSTQSERQALRSVSVESSEVGVSPEAGQSSSEAALSFSHEEDRLIRRWREKEGCCWAEIGLRLPHRSQQEVTDRYYDMIVGSASKTRLPKLHDPEHRPGLRYSDAESDQMLAMHEQGLSFEQMAEVMPGRSSTSLQNHFFGTLLTAKKIRHLRSEPVISRSGPANAPLLRQALGNSVRRMSFGEAGLSVSGYTQFSIEPPRFRKAVSPTDLDPQYLRYGQSKRLVESAFPSSPPDRVAVKQEVIDLTMDNGQLELPPSLPLPSHNPAMSSQSAPQHQPAMQPPPQVARRTERITTPEPPSTRSPTADAPDRTLIQTPSPHFHASGTAYPHDGNSTPPTQSSVQHTSPLQRTLAYETPARFGYGSMPYFVAPTAPMVPPTIEHSGLLRSPSPVRMDTHVAEPKASKTANRQLKPRNGEPKRLRQNGAVQKPKPKRKTQAVKTATAFVPDVEGSEEEPAALTEEDTDSGHDISAGRSRKRGRKARSDRGRSEDEWTPANESHEVNTASERDKITNIDSDVIVNDAPFQPRKRLHTSQQPSPSLLDAADSDDMDELAGEGLGPRVATVMHPTPPASTASPLSSDPLQKPGLEPGLSGRDNNAVVVPALPVSSQSTSSLLSDSFARLKSSRHSSPFAVVKIWLLSTRIRIPGNGFLSNVDINTAMVVYVNHEAALQARAA